MNPAPVAAAKSTKTATAEWRRLAKSWRSETVGLARFTKIDTRSAIAKSRLKTTWSVGLAETLLRKRPKDYIKSI